MPLFEVETDAHIIITWASDEPAAGVVVREAYPHDKVVRIEGAEPAVVRERLADHGHVRRVRAVALVERAVSLSDEKYCSATAMIKKSAKVSHEVLLVEI